MANKKITRDTQPETPEPPQIMNPQSTEEREKKKLPISDRKKGNERREASEDKDS
ncbi:MAG TPA: hypothetical protein VIL31_11030 [Cyclobacteriaceae bacterium]|jgi:hypothetical protein